jgi:hypothetical protein
MYKPTFTMMAKLEPIQWQARHYTTSIYDTYYGEIAFFSAKLTSLANAALTVRGWPKVYTLIRIIGSQSDLRHNIFITVNIAIAPPKLCPSITNSIGVLSVNRPVSRHSAMSLSIYFITCLKIDMVTL